jgi:hypothetical protein
MVEKTGALDGKIFVGEFGKKGRETEGMDELIFKDGKFRSTCCDSYGFGDAPYTTTVNGDAITFEAETFSTSEGKIKWIGTVKGNILNCSFTRHKLGKWYRVSKEPKEYWVRAQLKK